MRPARGRGGRSWRRAADGPPMSPAVRSLLLVAVLAAFVLVVRSEAGPPPTAPGFAVPDAASRARSFTWVEVSPTDQLAVRRAIDGARPEARRLVDAVAGLVQLRVGPAGPDAAGTTRASAAGYAVELDLAGVSAALGPRGLDRLVLHELGHVVDFALVPDALLATLDARIPAGYGCEHGRLGSCAAPEERFAETFAKWAMDDIGVSLEIGYKVPPPSMSLGDWGTPLSSVLPT
ncbi:MAG: hypothetical protein JWO90_985 [Solirubrobacterales bacterium]|jgi:hypothetical protein|nr:hypothetical protein [Solirubrobacterales bacterium]